MVPRQLLVCMVLLKYKKMKEVSEKNTGMMIKRVERAISLFSSGEFCSNLDKPGISDLINVVLTVKVSTLNVGKRNTMELGER